ncbi:DCC1-like thiol-disulfide oxidoreductase family protein [Micromonospora sp. CPCC 205539]|uniref:thiol-disulfide oxidoreductase DCC family protein n=1 Tax=Micromonospora sp. CPCC 205539 TaxID=3122408 RepID=UPI002FF28D17
MTVPPTDGPGRFPDPAAHGGGGIRGFTVLFDANCPLCRAARRWLSTRAQLVPLEFVPAGSTEARRRFPGLNHETTLRDLTVVADTGEVYAGDGAWFACLWALADHRSTADRLARPHLLPLARRVVATASAIREQVRDPGVEQVDELAGYGDLDDRTDCAADQCGRADDHPR